jgi:hypothetical protein
MGQIFMKEAPDVDYYVAWSSVVEAPAWTGNREGAIRRMQRDADKWLRDDAPHHPNQRIARVDETGTSSQWVEHNNMRDRFAEEGSWEDDSYIYMQRGVLTRAGLFELCHRTDADGDADVSDLLKPFDDTPIDAIETPS